MKEKIVSRVVASVVSYGALLDGPLSVQLAVYRSRGEKVTDLFSADTLRVKGDGGIKL